MPRGRLPTGMVATTLSVAASMTVTVFPRSFETYTSGSAEAPAAAASESSERSVTVSRPRIIDAPPSRREPAPAVRHRRAERVEIGSAQVAHDGERAARSADLLALPRPGDVERLAELVVPLAEREGVALVAVERRRRLQVRDERAAVERTRAHDGLADQLEGGPGCPGDILEWRIELSAKAAVQLTRAEALEFVMPRERPDPGRPVRRRAHSDLANAGNPIRRAPVRHRAT